MQTDRQTLSFFIGGSLQELKLYEYEEVIHIIQNKSNTGRTAVKQKNTEPECVP